LGIVLAILETGQTNKNVSWFVVARNIGRGNRSALAENVEVLLSPPAVKVWRVFGY
jgi:hypothetical protein